MLKAINISAREIANLKELPNNWRCISVNEEYAGYYPIGFDPGFKDKRVLRVRFSDVTAPITKATHGDKKFNPITEEVADQICKFVKENKDRNFISHCAAGVSRSAAICLFIHLAYGHKLKEHFFTTSLPNKFILGSLLVSKVYSDSLNS